MVPDGVGRVMVIQRIGEHPQWAVLGWTVAVRMLVVCLVGVSGLLSASAAGLVSSGAVAEEVGETEPADVWVVSTRRLPGVRGLPGQAHPGVERLACGGCPGRWEPSGLDDLLGDAEQPLVVFIHGNRYDAASAKTQGQRLARRLRQPDGRGPRVVIFSWPSAKQGILLKDSRRKYERAPSDGHYLAWFLTHLSPEQPVAIVGYSFGALVALEALRDLAAESPPAAGVPWRDRPGRTHLVLVAPAVRCDALAPRGPYRLGLDGVDRLSLVINTSDEALRFFHLVDPRVRADALGFVGMPRSWLPSALEYTTADAAPVVGHDHSFRPYLDAPSLARRLTAAVIDGL